MVILEESYLICRRLVGHSLKRLSKKVSIYLFETKKLNFVRKKYRKVLRERNVKMFVLKSKIYSFELEVHIMSQRHFSVR